MNLKDAFVYTRRIHVRREQIDSFLLCPLFLSFVYCNISRLYFSDCDFFLMRIILALPFVILALTFGPFAQPLHYILGMSKLVMIN